MLKAGVAGSNIFWRLRAISRLVLQGFVLGLFEFVLYAGTTMKNLV